MLVGDRGDHEWPSLFTLFGNASIFSAWGRKESKRPVRVADHSPVCQIEDHSVQKQNLALLLELGLEC